MGEGTSQSERKLKSYTVEKQGKHPAKGEGISKAIDCSMHYKKVVRTFWSKLSLPFSPKLMYIATGRHSLQYIASKTRV